MKTERRPGSVRVLLFFKLQQGFSVVPDLLEGSQEVQRFPSSMFMTLA